MPRVLKLADYKKQGRLTFKRKVKSNDEPYIVKSLGDHVWFYEEDDEYEKIKIEIKWVNKYCKIIEIV
jgi:hypothetical protein